MTNKYRTPAFPRPAGDYNGTRHGNHAQTGIDLLDYFAAKVMQGLLANPGGPVQMNGTSGWGWCNCTQEDVASFAYEIAASMIEAKERYK